MQKKVIFFAGAVVCLLIAAWGYYQYQKPRKMAAQQKAATSITAEGLYAAYQKNETLAGEKFNDKIIEVSGVVSQVQATAGGANILLAAGPAGGVNCSMQQSAGGGPAVGTLVKIKGRCTGFLLDVNLVDAVQVAD